MTYRETLNKARENNINPLSFIIANECSCQFEFEYTEQEFESLCNKVEIAFLKAETVGEWAIAYAINTLIIDEEKTIEQVLEMDIWDLIEMASDYM